jgi:GT2 family glycosyltransferase
MHNDVFVYEDNWVSTLSEFICKTQDAGIVGLYGAKTMSKDGRYLRRVHRKVYRRDTSKRDAPYVFGRVERVGVVDGQLISVHRDVLEKIGGFNEELTIHYYDIDISMKALKNKKNNYVLAFPFEHLRGTTRKNIPGDKKIMEELRSRFMEMWYTSLPVDVTNWKGKISYMLRRRYLPYVIHLKRWLNKQFTLQNKMC